MKASITHPVYSARLVKDDGMTYYLKDITTDLNVSHPKNELAEKATISLVNIKVGSGRLYDIITVKDRLYVNADTGSGAQEVFRGFVWSKEKTNDADSDEISLICYDRLIYWHNSKDNFFAKAGKQTKDVISSIASKWGMSISYKYLSISHAKLVYHNESIADIVTDILNQVKKQTGVDYVIRMEDNTIVIEPVGSNKTVYKLAEKENAVSTYDKQTMDGMVTQVLIVKAETTATQKVDGSIVEIAKSYMESDPSLSYADAIAKAKENSGSGGEKETGNYLTVATVSRNTAEYGTLQEIIVLDKDENLADAKEEANQILDDNSTPKKEKEAKSVDVPWVKKGHQIYISADGFNNYYIVDGIEHDSKEGIMYMEVSLYE